MKLPCPRCSTECIRVKRICGAPGAIMSQTGICHDGVLNVEGARVFPLSSIGRKRLFCNACGADTCGSRAAFSLSSISVLMSHRSHVAIGRDVYMGRHRRKLSPRAFCGQCGRKRQRVGVCNTPLVASPERRHDVSSGESRAGAVFEAMRFEMGRSRRSQGHRAGRSRLVKFILSRWSAIGTRTSGWIFATRCCVS